MVKSERGFTLFELMVVLGMLAVLAAIALPNLSDWRKDSRLRETAQKIVTVLRDARSQAITTNKTYRVSFDLPGQRFSLQMRKDDLTWPAPDEVEWVPISAPSILRGGLGPPPCGISADTNYNVEYAPNGVASGTINLCVMGADAPTKDVFQVAIDAPMSGRAFVRD